MSSGIDIIIPWVDGNDPVWQREREQVQSKYSINAKANSHVRFESWDNLQYIFRGIEKFIPWVDKVLHVGIYLNLSM